MTKHQILIKVREKLTKLSLYNDAARKMWGTAIAHEMFCQDLEFYNSLLALLEEEKE